MSYRSPGLTVTVTATCREDGVELVADVTPHEKTLLEFALPGRLRFNPDELQRLVCPTDGNGSPGMGLRGSFFKMQDQWQSVSVGGKGYASLWGGQPVMRADNDPPVPIQVTAEGRKWLGPGFSATSRPRQASVNRPPQAGQFDMVLADSKYGPFFSSRKLDAGRLWCLGGTLCGESENFATEMVAAVLTRLADKRPEARGKLGLLSLRLGPTSGGFTCLSPQAWAERLRGLPSVASGKVQLAVLESVEQLTAAQAGGEFWPSSIRTANGFRYRRRATWPPPSPGSGSMFVRGALVRSGRLSFLW